MTVKRHVAIIALAAIALAWETYALVVRRYANAPVSPEVFVAKLENLRTLNKMDSQRRERLIVSLARVFRRVPLSQREAVFADPTFREAYTKNMSREDRLLFIAYTLPEVARVQFDQFVKKSEKERVDLVRRWFRGLKDNEAVQAQWPSELLAALDNDILARLIAENLDILFADPSPMGKKARQLLNPMMQEARGSS